MERVQRYRISDLKDTESEKTIKEFETMQYLLFLTCSLEEGENNDDG